MYKLQASRPICRQHAIAYSSVVVLAHVRIWPFVVLRLLVAIVATLRHVTKGTLSCRCVHTRAMSMRRGRFSESITSIVRPTSYHDCVTGAFDNVVSSTSLGAVVSAAATSKQGLLS